MRIAYFTDVYLPAVNGVSYSVEQFSQALAKVGHQVMVIAPAYERRTGRERAGGVAVERFRSVPARIYPGAHVALPNFGKIYDKCRDFAPEVVHIHTPGTLGIAGLLLARWQKWPVVGTYHTLVSEMPMYFSPKTLVGWPKIKERMLGNGFLRSFSEELKMLREVVEWEKKEGMGKESAFEKISWFLVNKFYNYCDGVVVPSGAIKRELLKRGMNRPIWVISNGIDLEQFRPGMEKRRGKMVLHVGRLGYEKNVDVVIGVFGRVLQTEAGARLVVAGDGPARENLEKLAADLGIAERVEFIGMVPRRRLIDYYRQAEVFVTASAMETQGMVILEAMACGLPVVGADKYATSDLVKPGKNGYLFGVGEAGEAAKWIVKILGDEKLRDKLGREARNTAQGHEIGRVVRQMEKVYGQLAAKKTGKRKGIWGGLTNWLEVGSGSA